MVEGEGVLRRLKRKGERKACFGKNRGSEMVELETERFLWCINKWGKHSYTIISKSFDYMLYGTPYKVKGIIAFSLV